MIEVKLRTLKKEELNLIWSIDRSEEIHGMYHHENGELVLKPERFSLHGWPGDAAERSGPWLMEAFNREGFFKGAFVGSEIVGVVVLDSRLLGPERDMLQMMFLHVGKSRRKTGLGKRLFNIAVNRAREMGAATMYISSMPSENTVNFYRHMGCRVAEHPVQELFEMEPEDIHMKYSIRSI